MRFVAELFCRRLLCAIDHLIENLGREVSSTKKKKARIKLHECCDVLLKLLNQAPKLL